MPMRLSHQQAKIVPGKSILSLFYFNSHNLNSEFNFLSLNAHSINAITTLIQSSNLYPSNQKPSMTSHCTFNCDYLKIAFNVIHKVAPINFQTLGPQFIFTHFSFQHVISETLVWFRHLATFQILCSSGFQTLACIRISRGFIKTDCWTITPEVLIQKEWIYICHKVLKWCWCYWSALPLVNHYSTPKATNWLNDAHPRV